MSRMSVLSTSASTISAAPCSLHGCGKGAGGVLRATQVGGFEGLSAGAGASPALEQQAWHPCAHTDSSAHEGAPTLCQGDFDPPRRQLQQAQKAEYAQHTNEARTSGMYRALPSGCHDDELNCAPPAHHRRSVSNCSGRTPCPWCTPGSGQKARVCPVLTGRLYVTRQAAGLVAPQQQACHTPAATVLERPRLHLGPVSCCTRPHRRMAGWRQGV